MPITNYDELIAAVGGWMARSDLAAIVPDFVALAEARFNRLIRTREMETRAVATATAGNAYLALPAAFGGARYVKLMADPPRLLRPYTPQQIDSLWLGSDVGVPQVFAVVGDAFRLAPAPDADYVVEISYSRKVTALSAGNPSNWLLAAHPDVYLYGTLVAAEGYLGDDARIATWKSLFDEALIELENQDAIDRWSGGPMAVRADAGAP